jgi:hypothetical protein
MIQVNADVVYDRYQFYENVKGKEGFEGMEGPMMVICDCGVVIPVPGCNGMTIDIRREKYISRPYVRINFSNYNSSRKASCLYPSYKNIETGYDLPINKMLEGVHGDPQDFKNGFLLLNTDEVDTKESRTDPNRPVLIIRLNFKPDDCSKDLGNLYIAHDWVDYYNQFPVKKVPSKVPSKEKKLNFADFF